MLVTLRGLSGQWLLCINLFFFFDACFVKGSDHMCLAKWYKYRRVCHLPNSGVQKERQARIGPIIGSAVFTS